MAANSGIPPIKSFLNGTLVKGGLLDWRTCIAKLVGIILIVATNLPLGREGPMVHIGAMLAAIITHLPLPGTRDLLELRLPEAQRAWVGIGAAAGVAAAFNAPFGGILYSFEEVCSTWTEHMTWRAFFCVVIVSLTYTFCVEFSNDELQVGLSINLQHDVSLSIFRSGQIGWVVLLAGACGALGACYNAVVLKINEWFRKPALKGRPWAAVLDAALTATLCFTAYYWAPLIFDCRPCPTPTGGSHRMLAEAANGNSSSSQSDICEYSGHEALVQHLCPDGYYSELATLLLGGQERTMVHLLSRRSWLDSAGEVVFLFNTPVLGFLLVLYFILATMTFGIRVPAGNFVPGIIIGATTGRLYGELLVSGGLSDWAPGMFALVGAGAVLSGITRMTLTLVAILTEVADDIRMVPTMMLACAAAKSVANKISHSFDHGMMHLNALPFLDESPPVELDILVARNAMATPVVSLPNIVKVGELVKTLKTNTCNGFPVVHREQPDRLCGLIIRRQLLVLLRDRVWQYKGSMLPLELLQEYIASFAPAQGMSLGGRRGSASSSATAAFALQSDLDHDCGGTMGKVLSVDGIVLREHDMEEYLDLRDFMDPAPAVVSELTPLFKMYRLFNEIGVRHLPVLDEHYKLVGIVTRKDLRIHNMKGAIHKALQGALGGPKPPPAQCYPPGATNGSSVNGSLSRESSQGDFSRRASGRSDMKDRMRRWTSRASGLAGSDADPHYEWRWSKEGTGGSLWSLFSASTANMRFLPRFRPRKSNVNESDMGSVKI